MSSLIKLKIISVVSIFAIIGIYSSYIKIVYAHIGIADGSTTVCGTLDSTDIRVHSANQIDNRLTLASSSNGVALYTSRDFTGTTTPWTPNSNSWTKKGTTTLDFTGVAGYLVVPGTSNQPNGLGTLISPRHFVSANHYSASVGHVLGFLDASGNRVERRVTAIQSISGTDINVGVLDSDVPDSITYYPLIASTTLQSFLQPFYGATISTPITVFDQEGKAIVHNLTNLTNTNVYHSSSTSGLRSGFSEDIASGDSGNPGFIIIDGIPVLLFSHYSASYGPNYGNYLTEINAAMTVLGGGYQVTQYSNTCFSEPVQNHIPTITATSSLSYVYSPILSTSTLVTSFTATDADAGQGLTFSIVSLSGSGTTTALTFADFFTIATTSTTLSLYQSATIDPDIYGATLTLIAKVEDVSLGNTLIGSSTATKTIFVSDSVTTDNGTIVYDSQFERGNTMYPTAIKFDSQGILFVKDEGSGNIVKFDSDDTFLSEFNGSTTPLQIFSLNYSIDFDTSGYMYISEQDGGKVLKINADTGAYVSTIGTYGSSAGQYLCPSGVVFDSLGNMYITDSCGNKVMKYNSSGVFVSEFGSLGTSNGSFNNPMDIAVDTADNLYVADYSNHRIQKFDSSGTFILKFGSLGVNDGQLYGPVQLRVDSSNNTYVADSGNNRVQKFNSTGTYVTQFGSLGSGDTQFRAPYSLELDSNNDIYVADLNNNVIKKFIQLAAPSAPTLQTASDTGDSNSDGVTADTTPTFDIVCTNNRTVSLYAGSTVVGTSTCSSNIAQITASTLSVNTFSVTATQGNSSGTSSSSSAYSLQIINPPSTTSGGGGSSGGGSGGGGGGGSATIYYPNTLVASTTKDKITGPILTTSRDVAIRLNVIGLKLSKNNQIQMNAVPLILNRSVGSRGEDIRQLQKLLNALGYQISKTGAGSPGNESQVFGLKTKLALSSFQKANKVFPASGSFGPLTRAKIASFLLK